MNKINKEERLKRQIEFTEKMVLYLPSLRAAAQITQNQLAKRLAITRASVIHIESGKRKLQFHMYLAIVLIFMQNENSKNLIESLNLFESHFIQKLH